jgi:hypothetical protein
MRTQVLLCSFLLMFLSPIVRLPAGRATIVGNPRSASSNAESQPQNCTLASVNLTSQLPGDASVPFSAPFADQCAVDQFAWQNFIALNWPAASFDPNDSSKVSRGLPDTTRMIGDGTGDSQAVWEMYQPNSYVFAINANGSLNPPAIGIEGWQTATTPPSACGGKAQKSLVLTAISKAVDEPAGLEQAFSGPLVDQNGYYARYEVLLNFDAYNYIVSNHLYDTTQQNIQINFPAGDGQQTGTIMLKASWKVLSPGEIASGRFHVSTAFLFNPAVGSQDGTQHVPASCTGPVKVGLVGLHIAHKTASMPQWVWATFEQVDNAPDRGDPGTGRMWSFFNPSCSNCQPNTQPTCPNQIGSGGSPLCDWQPNIQHPGTSTQVLRDIPVSDDVPGPLINQDVQQRLKKVSSKSVWQFYQLVDAQWPLKPCGSIAGCQAGQVPVQCAFPDFSCAAAQPIPAMLSNTTMETYFQSKSSAKPQRGTCLGCHGALAGTQQGNFSDFTFELENAHTPPTKPMFVMGNATK